MESQVTKNTFHKSERLSDKTLINKLFTEGNRVITQFPFRVLWQPIKPTHELYRAMVLFVVPKRTFKKSTQRNRIKRQMRELYRLNKNQTHQLLIEKEAAIVLSITYVEKKMTEYKQLSVAYQKLIKKIHTQIEQNL
jgi:ribonuclease P protein component